MNDAAATRASGEAAGPVPVLETERLVLRGVKPEDFEPFAAFYAAESARFVGGPKEPAEAWRSLAASAGSWMLRGFGEFAVEEKASGRLAGLVGPWFPEGWPEKEIAWIILPEFQRQAYGAEAASRALTYAYEELGWPTAVSFIANENIASIRLAEKLGAQLEGEAEIKPYGMMPFYRHLPPEEFLARSAGAVQ